jgi:hypothetical protein
MNVTVMVTWYDEYNYRRNYGFGEKEGRKL